MSEITLGIDLGTTYSVVAYVDEEGQPHLVLNLEQQVLTPSAVLIEDGRIEVGENAAHQAIVKPDHVVQWIKRSMGDEDYRFQNLTPVQISAEILKKLKHDAEVELSQPLRQAVITCPAYFAGPEVENTKKAGELAGFEVLEIVREPTAAAVYYGVEHLQEGERFLVYDLGGGTFDVTVLELREGKYRPLATLGNRQLGGHDFTSALLEYVARQFTEQWGEDPRDDPQVHQALYERCEVAKRDLARLDRATVSCVFRGRTGQVEVGYETLNALVEHQLMTTIYYCERVLTKAEPPLSWREINGILLVGGSTRLRRVPAALRELSGLTPVAPAEVDTMVALGAAIIARGYVKRRGFLTAGDAKTSGAGLVSVITERTLPRHLGTKVITWEEGTPQIVNSLIIPVHTELPTEQTREDYALTIDGQPYFDIPVVEFDEIGVDEILNTYRFHCLPHSPRGSGIGVTFRYDLSGCLEADAWDLRSGQILPKEQVEFQEPDLTNLKPGATGAAKPRRVVFAMDVSGSMDGDKIKNAKRALTDLAKALLEVPGADTQVGLVIFGSEAETGCGLTTNFPEISRAVGAADTYGTTRMDLAIHLAVKMLRPHLASHSCEIALVTDGMPDSSGDTLQAAEAAKRECIDIKAVGIGSQDVDEEFMRKVAPEFIMIEGAEQLSEALTNLLMHRAPAGKATAISWGNP